MPQIDPKDLDYSPEMLAYFEEVIRILISRDVESEEARAMVNRFFALGTTPLERALVMHRGAERVAKELLGSRA